jgi:radical SAM superfamily enzyme YgiQ (UPF0313 family)
MADCGLRIESQRKPKIRNPKSEIRVNPLGPLPELTELPLKDYESMDFQRLIDAKNGWVGLMASRGCPFSCTYCFNHLMVEAYKKDLHCGFQGLHYIRRFTVGQMLEEIEYLLKNYRNIRMFIFDDDLFTFDKAAVREFCGHRRVTQIPSCQRARGILR